MKKKEATWLTWPKNKNGRRKVNPLHIQDWKPSVGSGHNNLIRFRRHSWRHERRLTATSTAGDRTYRSAIFQNEQKHSNVCKGGGWNVTVFVKVLKLIVLTDCQVHGVAFSQRSQSVQTATLVVILQKLNKTCRKTVIICNSKNKAWISQCHADRTHISLFWVRAEGRSGSLLWYRQ